MLHENGRVNGLIGKQEEKKSKIEENVSDRAKAQTDETESMQCDISTDHEEEFKFKIVTAPNPATTSECMGPNGLEDERGPLALPYEGNTGWIAEKLGRSISARDGPISNTPSTPSLAQSSQQPRSPL